MHRKYTFLIIIFLLGIAFYYLFFLFINNFKIKSNDGIEMIKLISLYIIFSLLFIYLNINVNTMNYRIVFIFFVITIIIYTIISFIEYLIKNKSSFKIDIKKTLSFVLGNTISFAITVTGYRYMFRENPRDNSLHIEKMDTSERLERLKEYDNARMFKSLYHDSVETNTKNQIYREDDMKDESSSPSHKGVLQVVETTYETSSIPRVKESIYTVPLYTKNIYLSESD